MSVVIGQEALGSAAREFLDAAPHGLLIGGKWQPAASNKTFTTLDPSTGNEVCSVADAGAADVDAAVAAARAAFESGKWPKLSGAERAARMFNLAGLLEEHRQELAQLEALDNGKPVSLANFIDVGQAIAHLRYFGGWATKIEGNTIPVSQPNMLVYTLREPVGVCGQIVPWNFPLLMAVWKIAPALCTGCTVVLKPAEQTPLTAIRLGQLIVEAGFPDGVVNVVTGDGSVGAAIVDHPGVDKIAFTGSTSVGREIGEKAGRALKRVTLELGGKNPNIILPDANIDAAVGGSFQGIYFNTGQVCTSGSRLFVHKSQYDEVIEKLAGLAEKARVGPGLAEDVQFGPVVSEAQYERVSTYIKGGIEAGANAVAGGDPGELNGGGYFINPTLFTDVKPEMPIAREEIFGPVLVAMPYDSVEEVAALANDTEYGLAAGVWTQNISNAHKLAALLKAGSVYINIWGPADSAAPFGGYKASGIGREMGHANLDAYLETKTVWTNLR